MDRHNGNKGETLKELLKDFSTEKFLNREDLLREFQKHLEYFDAINTETFVSRDALKKLKKGIMALRETLENLKAQLPEKIFESQFEALFQKINKLFKDFSQYVERNNSLGTIDNTFAYTETIDAIASSFHSKIEALYLTAPRVIPPSRAELLHESPYEKRIYDWFKERNLNIDDIFLVDKNVSKTNPHFRGIQFIKIVPPEVVTKLINMRRLIVPQEHVLVTPATNQDMYLALPLSALKGNLN